MPHLGGKSLVLEIVSSLGCALDGVGVVAGCLVVLFLQGDASSPIGKLPDRNAAGYFRLVSRMRRRAKDIRLIDGLVRALPHQTRLWRLIGVKSRECIEKQRMSQDQFPFDKLCTTVSLQSQVHSIAIGFLGIPHRSGNCVGHRPSRPRVRKGPRRQRICPALYVLATSARVQVSWRHNDFLDVCSPHDFQGRLPPLPIQRLSKQLANSGSLSLGHSVAFAMDSNVRQHRDCDTYPSLPTALVWSVSIPSSLVVMLIGVHGA